MTRGLPATWGSVVSHSHDVGPALTRPRGKRDTQRQQAGCFTIRVTDPGAWGLWGCPQDLGVPRTPAKLGSDFPLGRLSLWQEGGFKKVAGELSLSFCV